jgi:hypothetical protein
MGCIHAIAYKGMDYPLKVELIVNMGYLDILESCKVKFRDRISEDAGGDQEE